MPCTVLHGHASPETAYVVEDYPYGYRLRCKIRYWIETAAKGAKGGQMRFMSQTTNPKLSGEHWNKPKGSTYHDFKILFLDEQGHVHNDGLGMYSWPEHFGAFSAKYGAQLDERQRAIVENLERVSRHSSPRSWAEWDAKEAERTAST